MDRVITWEEYSKHTNNLDCWLLIDGRVYNTTTFLAEHPGGDDVLLKYSGLDATMHTPYAVSIRDSRIEGTIESPTMPEGHEERVRQIKAEYQEKKRQRDQERRRQLTNLSQEARKVEEATGTGPSFTAEEVAKHCTKQDCWVAIDGHVYDVTNYLDEHPGGAGRILEFAGKDGTSGFKKAQHSANAKKIRQKFRVGSLRGYQPPKGRTSSELWGMLILTILLVVFSVYFFSTRQ